MKTKTNQSTKVVASEIAAVKTISLARAKEIVKEEGIAYTDEELTEVLQFVAKVVSITTGYHERTRQGEVKVISINTSQTHETKSIPLHPRKYRRAS